MEVSTRPQVTSARGGVTSKPERFDPITLEVIRNKLDGICNEMESTLIRSAFSTIVKEGHDASASLFTIHGETLAQAIALPVHLGTLIPMVREILRNYPLAEMKEGDVYIQNEPYMGGTHPPDIAIVKPIFDSGQPVAIAATLTHHQDVGGMTPGSVPTNATEVFQEGIRIPPLKYIEAGVQNETLLKILRLNVRVPDMFMGDLHAQVAACNVGARRIKDLAANYGSKLLLSIFDELLDRSELMTRECLRAIPEGTYRYSDFLDNDGIDLDRRIEIRVAITIKGGSMTCDFTGTSPQVKGPFNVVPSGPHAAAFFAVRALTDPRNIPTNGGCFRPVQLILPKGSLVNPIEPAPIGCRAATIKRVANTILGAMREVLPEKVPADSGNTLLVMMFGGRRSDGSRYVFGECIASGGGASISSDGPDVIDTDISNCKNLPGEALELDMPIRLNRASSCVDSGGAGKYRGGSGYLREYEVLDGEVTLTHRGERHYSPAAGAFGGKPGSKMESVIVRVDGSKEVIPSKIVTVLRKGDKLIVKTPGGGGYGDPKQRDREAVVEDIFNNKISKKAATEEYGLII